MEKDYVKPMCAEVVSQSHLISSHVSAAHNNQEPDAFLISLVTMVT